MKNKKFKIVSDNESYADYLDKVLVCTHASNSGRGYDSCMYPEMLMSFKLQDGSKFPFSLYEYEVEEI